MSQNAPLGVPQSGAVYVLDSSGMIAYLSGETEGVLVGQLFKTPGALFLAHTVNLCEVFYSFGPPSVASNVQNAQAAIQHLQVQCGVQERADMDAAFWQDVALLIAERRAMPKNPAKPKAVPSLALGDAFGLALARREGAEFVTKDRTEIEPMQVASFCRAFFIR